MDLGGRAAGRRVAAATLIAAAALALCACDGADPPVVTETPVPSLTATPSVSTSPSPSPSPAATLSAEELLALIPEESQWMNADGAIVTAEFYVGLLGEIFTTEDTLVWASLATPECQYCAGQVTNVEDLAASEWHAEGGAVTIDSDATEGFVGNDGFGYVRIAAEIDDLFAVNELGESQLAEAGSRTVFDIQLLATHDGWRINGVQLEQP
jgi:hypothetical protein